MTIIIIINIVLLNPEFSINRTTDLVIRKMHHFVVLLGGNSQANIYSTDVWNTSIISRETIFRLDRYCICPHNNSDIPTAVKKNNNNNNGGGEGPEKAIAKTCIL